MQLQGFLRTCQGAHAATDAFIDIDLYSPGFIIQGEGVQKASIRAGFAANAIIACPGHEVGWRQGIRIVPPCPSLQLGATTSAAEADEPIADTGIGGMAHETEFDHFIQVVDRLLFGHPLAQAVRLEDQGGAADKDAGPDRESVLSLASSQLLGSGAARAGD